ncbi:hypothetical protein ACFLZZ_04255 [Nanoarchaeota archaeon]
MRIEFLKSGERREVLRTLKDFYGISKFPYLLLRSGKEKIRGYSGHLSKEEIIMISKIASIEGIGLYVLKKGEGLKLSFDATQMMQSEIVKSIFKMNEEQYTKWISGEDVEAPSQKGVLVMEYSGDFIGCGKSNGEKIFNQIPKERRIKLNRKV